MGVMAPTNIELQSESVTGAKTLDEGDGGAPKIVQ